MPTRERSERKEKKLQDKVNELETYIENERRKDYIRTKINNFSFLIIGNILYFVAISTMLNIVSAWYRNGVYPNDHTGWAMIVGIWMLLFLQGLYRLGMNLGEMFGNEINTIGEGLRKFVTETIVARREYLAKIASEKEGAAALATKDATKKD